MAYPQLKLGMNNRAVLAAQNGLHRALASRGLPHTNLRNRAYGSRTADDVCRFKRAFVTPSGPVDCNTFGSLAWPKLEPFLGEYDRYLLRQHEQDVEAARKAREAAEAEKAAGGAVRRRLGEVAMKFYTERARFRYSWVRPYLLHPFTRWPGYYDCSSSVTVMYHEAGAPDPSGRGFDGFGFTGTQWPRGTFTWTPRIGDLAFYGYDARGPYPSHVAIVVPTPTGKSGVWVVSFGSNPVRLVPANYRSDLRGFRSYL